MRSPPARLPPTWSTGWWAKQARGGIGYCRCIRSVGAAPVKKLRLPSFTWLPTPRGLSPAPPCCSTADGPLSNSSAHREGAHEIADLLYDRGQLGADRYGF